MKTPLPHGSFVNEDGERWYRIENLDAMAPFFIALTGDSDLWAFLSTNGSLAAGRRDQEQSFFPYETVDKIHTRWETTGPRTWLRFAEGGESVLWEPFARRSGPATGTRNLYKNLTGTKLLFEELHSGGNLIFRQTWSSSGRFGLVRKAALSCRRSPVTVDVLDGLLNLLPAGISNGTYNSSSALADAYKWNEAHAGGRLGVYTMYAQLWDRAEPKESLEALTAWHSGLTGAKTLLSARQVGAFCAGAAVESETLTRGRTSAFLVQFSADIGVVPKTWYQVIDGPFSQAKVADLAARLQEGWGSPLELEEALVENTRGLEQLVARADGFQKSATEMAAVHHTANVLFNIMRGGVFPEGTLWDTDDWVAFVAQRNRDLAEAAKNAVRLAGAVGNGVRLERSTVLAAAKRGGPQLERLAREYLPLTFSRRHGDPSRPWNRFSIRVRDAQGKRVLNHQGNWRDIFQNWEALLWSEPAYADSMVGTFLSAMTPDGYNPYRIGRDGIDWETIEADDPWSFIGYWGDHQVVYLLRLLEATQSFSPGLLESYWTRPAFTFADVPYRIKPYPAQIANPKSTIDFDHAAHHSIMERTRTLGADGKLVLDAHHQPLLGSLAEKLVTIVVSKIGNLVPGGGIWLNTQRPEWNDANNALVGNGLSIVTLASLRRMITFLLGLPVVEEPFELAAETGEALHQLSDLAAVTPLAACTDDALRRTWMDAAGPILDAWRAQLYRGGENRRVVTTPAGALRTALERFLPLVDATLHGNQRPDGLYHSYNLLTLSAPTQGPATIEGPSTAQVGHLYPMLEGQVALLSSGLLEPTAVVALAQALRASDIYDPRRRSYRLYPDRKLPGFLAKNCLDEAALALPLVQRLLRQKRSDLFETQADGTVRFASKLANRYDVETALAEFGPEARPVADAYDRLLGHKAFTGRSGTMFGYEGLDCIYWHMVAKLLLALQENVFAAADKKSPHVAALAALYRDVRSGLGYHKTPAEYGAFPFDPYSHTPGEGGAQQPGMTGQVKEEVLTRWGELGLRWVAGRLLFQPLLMDREEIPETGPLEFTFQRIPFSYHRSAKPYVRVQTAQGWAECRDGAIPLAGALSVEAGM